MWTKEFWKGTAERAIRTFAQVAIALLLADGTNLFNSNWGAVLSVAGMSALLAVLTCIATGVFTKASTPGITEVPTIDRKV